jgi:hypothetical protein
MARITQTIRDRNVRGVAGLSIWDEIPVEKRSGMDGQRE